MRPNALIFGSLSSLVDAGELHRQAYNLAFREAGLDWEWSPEEFSAHVQVPMQRRVAEFAASKGVVVDCAALHERKSLFLSDLLHRDGASLRGGVLSVVSAAAAAAVPLGLVTSASRADVEAVLAATAGLLDPRNFAFIGDGAMCRPDDPAALYRMALRQMGVRASQALVITDKEPDLHAAQDAGLQVLAFTGHHVRGDFSAAQGSTSYLTPENVGLGTQECQRIAVGF